FPRGISTLISLLLALILFLVVFYFISNSIVSFRSDVPQMVQNINDLLSRSEHWIQQKFHVSTEKMQDFVQSSTDKILPSTSSIVNTTVTTVTSIFFIGIVIFITTFLLLLYRGLIVLFVTSLFAKEYTERIHGIFSKTRYVVRSYIVGLCIEMIVVAVAYCAALFIIGVKYA